MGISPGGGNGNPLQYSCLENSHGERSLVGYSPWGRKESDTTKVTEHACLAYKLMTCDKSSWHFTMLDKFNIYMNKNINTYEKNVIILFNFAFS